MTSVPEHLSAAIALVILTGIALAGIFNLFMGW
jgi:hypothetical protein